MDPHQPKKKTIVPMYRYGFQLSNTLHNVLDIKVYDEPNEIIGLKDVYNIRVMPDLITQSKRNVDIVEVKFLSKTHMIDHRLKEAEEQINHQIDKLKESSVLTDLNINHKTIVLVVYNFREQVNEGILLIKRNKIK